MIMVELNIASEKVISRIKHFSEEYKISVNYYSQISESMQEFLTRQNVEKKYETPMQFINIFFVQFNISLEWFTHRAIQDLKNQV